MSAQTIDKPGLAEPGTVVPPGVSYVDSPEKLQDLVSRVLAVAADSPHFRSCLDTEADSLHHYQEKLCLIQLAFGDEYALIDPLAVEDMAPLIAALDQGEVWFHGADYDLTLLRRTYGWVPARVRDTQIAARLTGSRQFGLAALVENFFQQKLSKASQKADWSRRPLSSTMLHYAVDDVRYLLPLADLLLDMLAGKSRKDWFVQSCEALCNGVTGRSTEPKEHPWKVQGSGRLQPRGLALLKALWEWRETIAQERDVPCFRIMSNKQLMDVALAFDHGQSLSPPAGWRPRWKKSIPMCMKRCLPLIRQAGLPACGCSPVACPIRPGSSWTNCAVPAKKLRMRWTWSLRCWVRVALSNRWWRAPTGWKS